MSCVQEVSLGRVNLLVTNPQLSLLQVFVSHSELCLLISMAPGSEEKSLAQLVWEDQLQFYFIFALFDRISPLGWPQMHSNLPASASRTLGFQT